jgi:hypothetical protein
MPFRSQNAGGLYRWAVYVLITHNNTNALLSELNLQVTSYSVIKIFFYHPFLPEETSN